MESLDKVIQPPFEEVLRKDHYLKGKWSREVFGNDQALTLELGCGKGEYTVGLARNYPEKNFANNSRIKTRYEIAAAEE